MKILLIEDDKYLSKSICNYLKLLNFEVEVVYDGLSAISCIDSNEYQLFLIDINVPHVNGLELLEHVRKGNLHAPVIIITASLEMGNMVKAYDSLCNDYIKKPFDIKELELRISKLIEMKNDKIDLGKGIVFDKKNIMLIRQKEEIKLRNKEFRLLSILVQRRGEVVSKQAIIDFVWDKEYKEAYPLRQLLAEVRKKLKDDIIHTEKNIGYRLLT